MDTRHAGAQTSADNTVRERDLGSIATKPWWKSTHPWGADIRTVDLKVLAFTALVWALLTTVTVIVMYFASSLIPSERMNFYIAGKVAGHGAIETDTRAFATVALVVCGLALLASIVAVLLPRVTTSGVFLLGILSLVLATLIAPFFIASGIVVIVAGPQFEPDGNPVYIVASIAGFVLLPAVAAGVTIVAVHLDKRGGQKKLREMA